MGGAKTESPIGHIRRMGRIGPVANGISREDAKARRERSEELNAESRDGLSVSLCLRVSSSLLTRRCFSAWLR